MQKSADRWPISPAYGVPPEHACTLMLRELYRTQGGERVAISLFADEMFEESDLTPAATSVSSSSSVGASDLKRFDMEWWSFWLHSTGVLSCNLAITNGAPSFEFDRRLPTHLGQLARY